MLSPDFLGRVNALLFPMLCIFMGKIGEVRTKIKKDLNSDDPKSSNYFLRLQSDCFEAPRRYVVPCKVTDNWNEDSETAILQFPHGLFICWIVVSLGLRSSSLGSSEGGKIKQMRKREMKL